MLRSSDTKYTLWEIALVNNLLLNGENHPDGVIINYFIKDLKENDYLKIDIENKDGSLIRSFTNDISSTIMKVSDDKNNMVGNPFNVALKSDNLMKLKPKSGGNRLIWDMRYPGFTSFDGMVLYSSPNLGPKVVFSSNMKPKIILK